ncbi:MAG: hydantoinase/oxoprolinase family protein [Thermodesulfobacteriota bacterium]|nr:hydantoinase/oxoprolinase family protein [Thermodesulfobacteriota bacterium]
MDTGGTFSDSVIIKQDGTFVTGKASTTPEDLEGCFFNCIEAASKKLGKKIEEVLSNTILLGFGTTAGTNALLTRAGGPMLGLITTKGMEDTTIIMRTVGRFAGLGIVESMHIAATDRPEPLIPRGLIKGVTERINSKGEVVIPLYEDEVRQAVKELVSEGVEGIAVITLWSFLNDAHERRIKEIIQEMAPNLTVTISSVVTPLIREYSRFNTTIINLYIGRPVRKLFSKVEDRLREYCYKLPLLVMQASGGLSKSDVVQPITTLHSGPVGALSGVEFFKELYGFKNCMGSDVGGTSFDICVVPEEGVKDLREAIVNRFHLRNPMREIISIGAGGGTIAYIDKLSGKIRVGPESAGSVPGPVCYGLGGENPTVTDADVVMNRIDPDYFLGGEMKLDRDKSYKAIKEKIADPMGITVEEAAYGIIAIVDNRMSSIISGTLGERGLDPEKFVLFAFGGAGATHCAGYSHGLRFDKVIVPPFASTFSAFGASTADVRHRYANSPYIVVYNLPFDVMTRNFKLKSLDDFPKYAIERFNQVNYNFEKEAFKDMADEGFKKDEIILEYKIEARYGGQLWEIVSTSPINRIESFEDIKTLIKFFENKYEELYGTEAKYPEGGFEIITMALEVSASAVKPVIPKKEFMGMDATNALKEKREVYFSGGFILSKIYEMNKLEYGNLINGPAIIEGIDTSLVIPPDRKVTVDEYGNMVMEY